MCGKYRFNFTRAEKLFSKVVFPFYNSTSRIGEFQLFPHQPLRLLAFLKFNHSNGQAGVSHCGFNLYFPYK